MLAVRRPSSYADAYGVVTGVDVRSFYDRATRPRPPHTADEIASLFLINVMNSEGDFTRSVEELSFDEGDIQGTFHVAGCPGVIGLWLASWSVAGTLADPLKGVGGLDATRYEVPDLKPADNGYMFRRGFVWVWPGGKRAYP